MEFGVRLKAAINDDKQLFNEHDDNIQNLVKLALPQRKRDRLSGAIVVPQKDQRASTSPPWLPRGPGERTGAAIWRPSHARGHFCIKTFFTSAPFLA